MCSEFVWRELGSQETPTPTCSCVLVGSTWIFSYFLFHTQESFPMAFITPHSQGGLGLSFPIPPLITTTPCEGLRDVTRGRDRVACAEEDGTKKSLKAAGSDGSQQRGCSSVAAWLNPGPGWLGLCAHERLQKKPKKPSAQTIPANHKAKYSLERGQALR